MTSAQDSVGFLWFGTQDGLARYDGVGFRVYEAGEGELASAYITALVVGADGGLWVGTSTGGVARYAPEVDAFRPIPLLDGSGTWQTAVRDMIELRDGRVVAALEDGIAVVDPASESARWIDPPALTADEPFSPSAVSQAPGDDRLWVGGEDGSILAGTPEKNGWTWSPVGRVRGRVHDLTWFADDSAFVAADPGGLAYLTLRPTPAVGTPPDRPVRGTTERLRVALRDGDGVTWLGGNGGLVRTAAGRASVFQPDGLPGSIPHALVLSLLEDKHGNLWVGTWQGLSKLPPYREAIRNRSLAAPGEIRPLGVVAIEGDDDGSLLLGGMGGRLLRLAAAESGEPIRLDPGTWSDIFALARTDDGSLWVGTHGTGLHRLAGGRIRSYRQGAGLHRIPDDDVSALYVDHQRQLWMGTMGEGLLRFDDTSGEFVSYTGPSGTWRPAESYIWPVVEDARMKMWFGATGDAGGVHSISADRAEMDSYSVGDRPQPFPNGWILTLWPAADTALWVGTQGGGLIALDTRTGKTRTYGVEDGLPDDNVGGVIGDRLGYVWVATNNGLARFDPRTERFWTFGRASGLRDPLFHANATHASPDGTLYFGGLGGLTIVKPHKLERRTMPPDVVLTDLHIHAERAPPSRIFARSGLRLAPDENFFTFTFAALDFTDPSQNRYQYMLDPLDEAWVDAGNGNAAHYTSVPSGTYTFRVRARNSEGVWNEEGLAIPVFVATPWYRTLWARMLGLALLATIAFALYAYRLQQLKARQALRLNIAGKLHDDIGANLSAMAIKAQVVESAKELTPAKRRQLAEVARLARESVDRVREAVWVVNTRYDTVSSLVAKMRDTVETLLDEHVRVDFRAPEDLPPKRVKMEIRQDTYLTFKEALQNILKHANASRVEIDVWYSDPHLSITIQDDGVGFDPGSQSTGNGLQIMQERAARRRGAVTVRSTPGGGTTVSIRIRLR